MAGRAAQVTAGRLANCTTMPVSLALIHGLGCDSDFWRPQVADLASLRWLVWVPDLPYHDSLATGVYP